MEQNNNNKKKIEEEEYSQACTSQSPGKENYKLISF
jgi:hypothetical protein